MTAFHLPIAVALANASKALAEGRLQLQQVDTHASKMCRYRLDPDRPDCGCAIGVSLPHELALAWDNREETSVRMLLSTGILTTDDEPNLIALQIRHDYLTYHVALNRIALGEATNRFKQDLALLHHMCEAK